MTRRLMSRFLLCFSAVFVGCCPILEQQIAPEMTGAHIPTAEVNGGNDNGPTVLAYSVGIAAVNHFCPNKSSAADRARRACLPISAPASALREAVVEGLTIQTQVLPMERATAVRLADRIMEGVENRGLTVLASKHSSALRISVSAHRFVGTPACDGRSD